MVTFKQGTTNAWDSNPERRYRDDIDRQAAGTLTITATYNGDAQSAKSPGSVSQTVQ